MSKNKQRKIGLNSDMTTDLYQSIISMYERVLRRHSVGTKTD